MGKERSRALKSSFSGFRKRNALKGNLGIITRKNSIKCMLLNVDGLSQISMEDVKNSVVCKDIDIVVLLETHFRAEQTLFHHKMNDFKFFETRRSDVAGDKQGGGIIVYCKVSEGLQTRVYKPDIESRALSFVNNERLWVTVETSCSKTAICAVYMACEGAHHEYWNECIISVIASEQAILRAKGYRVVFLGDFNGHIGNQPGVGIVGNKRDVNRNGHMLINFEKDYELSIINRSKICSGLWTRQAAGTSTILDYCIISKEHAESVISMMIDDSNHFGGDSDHNSIFVTLKDIYVVQKMFSDVKIVKPVWDIKEDQQWHDYTSSISKYIHVVNKSSPQTFANSFASIIHCSMMDSIGVRESSGSRPLKVPSLPKNILFELRVKRELSKEYKILQKQHERDKLSVPGCLPTKLLIDSYEILQNQKTKVFDLLNDFNKKQRIINVKSCEGPGKQAIKNFWGFVTNKEKKSSDIRCIIDERTGVLKCTPTDIAHEVECHIKNIFQGDFHPFSTESKYNHGEDHPYSKSDTSETDNNFHSYSTPTRLFSSDNSESLEQDPVGFLDSSFTVEEIKVAVRSLKGSKAKGWDDIPNECFKFASNDLLILLTEMYNMIKEQNILPNGWNHGRLVLIHKRGPVEILSNYRPLTVIISVSGLYSRVLNNRLVAVTEQHNLLGEIQAGFRKNRSGSDNNFVLNTILWKAKAEGKTVHKAYVDLEKAYDTVNREKLWEKLQNLNFGPSFINCIKTLYKDDCIKTALNGVSTKPVFLSRGVRQGCSLSPLLFALYLSEMGQELSTSTHGFILKDTRISALFFADDIVLISSSSHGLIDLISIVKRHCDMLKMKISIGKSKVVSPSDDPYTVIDQYGEDVLTLERVVMYKYLGLETYNSMHKTGSEKQKKAILSARRFKGACINISHRGPDTTLLAATLWTSVALPSITFGCESIPFSDTSISTLNIIQSQLAKSIIGVPISTVNFVAQTELGFVHFGHYLWSKQLTACLRWIDLPEERWARKAMFEHMSGNWESPYWKYICKIKNIVNMPFLHSREMIQLHLDTHFISKLNDSIISSKLEAFKMVKSLSRALYVTESPVSSIIAGVKVNNCRGVQCQGADRSRQCPVCPPVTGPLPPKSSEYHVTWVCPAVSGVRLIVGITSFKNLCLMQGLTEEESFYLYINGFDMKENKISLGEMLDRGKCVKSIREAWLTKFMID